MIAFEDARRKILELAVRLPAERVALDDACGRVLAEDVVAQIDLPGFDASAMDGYAVRTADLSGDGPIALTLAGESRAGAASREPLAKGAACRIFTGAELPPGADAVVMQEDVTRDGTRVSFQRKPAACAHVRRRGEDLSAGTVALVKGTRLAPSHAALAATCDRAWLMVARRPVVTVLGTGDELRSPGAPGAPGSIPESNGVAIRAMARAAGALARVAPSVIDDRTATERAFEDALRGTDVLVTIGGVSVGDRDLVRPALEAIGCSITLYKVAIKPGKPLTIGQRGGAIVLGLPGNPASAMITFALFGVPLLRAMQADRRPLPRVHAAKAARAMKHTPGRTEFVRATLAREGGSLLATPLRNQSSGATTALAAADALIVVPSEADGVAQGAPIDVIFLRDVEL